MRTQLKLISRVWRLIWNSSGRWPIVWGVLTLLQALFTGALVLLTKTLVNSLAHADVGRANPQQTWYVANRAGLAAGIMIAQRILGGFTESVNTVPSACRKLIDRIDLARMVMILNSKHSSQGMKI